MRHMITRIHSELIQKINIKSQYMIDVFELEKIINTNKPIKENNNGAMG